MDTFDINWLQNKVDLYKNNLKKKFEANYRSEKNMQNQREILCMLLDYIPESLSKNMALNGVKCNLQPRKNFLFDTFQKSGVILAKSYEYADDNNVPSLNSSHSNSSLFDEDIRKDSSSFKRMRTHAVSNNSSNIKNYSRKIVKDIINEIIDKVVNVKRTNKRKHFFCKKIRVYIFETKKFYDQEYLSSSTLNDIKKSIYTKLNNTANFILPNMNINAYEFREVINDLPNMSNNAYNDNQIIYDLGIDKICFVLKSQYVHSKNDSSLSRKLFGIVLNDTGKFQANIKIYLKLNKFAKNSISSYSIVQANNTMTLRDVFLTKTLQRKIKYKNIDLYYFIEHCDSYDNDDMNNELSLNLCVDRLESFELDLYFKKFEDISEYLQPYSRYTFADNTQ